MRAGGADAQCMGWLWSFFNPFVFSLPTIACTAFSSHQLASLQQEIDACVNSAFRNITVTLPAEPAAAATGDEQQQQQTHTFADIDDAAFAALGRDSPQLLMALLEAAQAADKAAWTAFQADLQTLKLKRQRLAGQLADARALLDAAQREASKRQGLGAASGAAAAFDAETAGMAPLRTTGAPVRTVRIVLVCGFESFNVALYNAAAKRLAALAPHIQLKVFSDRDIATRREAVAAALAGARLRAQQGLCSSSAGSDVHWCRLW